MQRGSLSFGSGGRESRPRHAADCPSRETGGCAPTHPAAELTRTREELVEVVPVAGAYRLAVPELVGAILRHVAGCDLHGVGKLHRHAAATGQVSAVEELRIR